MLITRTPEKTPGTRLPLATAMLASAALMPLAATAQEQTLSTVNVRADAEYQPDGYRASSTRVGKVLQDPHDVAQAVTTVTRSLMDEQQVSSLKDALRNVSGLTFNAAEGGRSGDNMNLRGFYTFGDMYLDGIRDTAQYNRETFNLEQVDVLRGAGAMLFGRGQAGGVINMVTKTPLPIDRNKVTTSIGTDNHREVTADLNKKFDQDTALRINLMNRDEGSWRSNPANGDQVEIHRQGFASSLALNQNSNNRFWINYQYLRTRDVPDYGISFDTATKKPQDRNASTFWGGNKNFDDSDTQILTLVNEYDISAQTQLRTQLRRAVYDRTYWAKTPNSTTAPTATLSVGGNQTRASKYDTLTLQSDLSTKFELAGMKHEFLSGVEFLKEDSFRKTLLASGTPAEYFPWAESTAAATRFHGKSYAIYAQDSIEFIPKWKATFGLRRDELDSSYSSSTSPKLSYGEWSTRSALSYHPNEETHYYLGHSDSFSPTADLYQTTASPLPAERSKVTELGAKWMLYDGDLSLRTALYRAQKDWERNTDLESTGALLSRKRTTDGIEFEMAGRITDKWEIFGGIALMKAKVNEQFDGTATGQTFAQATNNGLATGTTGVAGTGYATGEAADANELIYTNRANQSSEGQTPRNTPKYTANLWSTYRFLPNWKAGLGAETKGTRYGYAVGTCGTATQNTTVGDANYGKWSYNNCSNNYAPNQNPSYVRWDAMLTFEQKDYTVRLNIQNLFDKLYYDAIYDNGGFSIPGQRRKAILTTEFRF